MFIDLLPCGSEEILQKIHGLSQLKVSNSGDLKKLVRPTLSGFNYFMETV